MSLSISFAIPTYNFAEFIAPTIASIYAGLEHAPDTQIEVVIVDGASQDDTEAVVSELQKRYAGIRYVRMEKRGGIDFDLNHAASLCSHEYIWLLSADDTLNARWAVSLQKLLPKHAPDIALVPAAICSLDMKRLRRNPIFDFPAGAGEVLYRMSETGSLDKLLAEALTLEVFSSYMSAVIVKRSAWLELPARKDYFGSCWAHCVKLMPLIVEPHRSGKILYLNEDLLNKRMGNDSFMENGLVRRLGITVEGWDRILGEFFYDPQWHQKAWRLVLNDASIWLYGYAKITSKNEADRADFMRLAKTLYLKHRPTWVERLKYLLLWATPRIPNSQNALKAIVPALNQLRHRAQGLKSK